MMVDNSENINGARRLRSDLILANEKEFKSLGVQRKSVKSCLLQRLLHSSFKRLHTEILIMSSSMSFFMMRLAAVDHLSLAIFSTMPATDVGHFSVVGLDVG